MKIIEPSVELIDDVNAADVYSKIERCGRVSRQSEAKDDAAQEYNRVVAEAKAINLFDNLDLAILAIYADCYARYIAATKAIREHGLTATSRGAFTVSPYVEVADKSATQILKCSTKLGLAVTDRLKLIVPTIQEKKINKYLEHLE